MSSVLSVVARRPQRGWFGKATLCFLFFAGVCVAPRGHAEGLNAQEQKNIRAATFEVVVPKPANDPLTYEKPLPLDLLPYQYRNDKYESVGTAFSIGNGRYVTAGHVFAVDFGGLNGPPSLRDAAGNVYALGQIEKYSQHEDFVVFTLAEQPKQAAKLDIGARPGLNDTVYAVGNALGEGVVIRDGAYTSDTPENQDGRWKWMRFSAAASPGNSGGPLLDKNGKVVGVVLMKSPNENLNFALSIDQVMKAPDHLARIDTRETFNLPVFSFSKTLPDKQEFALPKSFTDFSAALLKLRSDFQAQGYAELLKENAAETFPHGAHSARLLLSNYSKSVPALILRGGDENWRYEEPHYGRDNLDNNGTLDWADYHGAVFSHLRRPDNVDVGKFYSDPSTYMDLILKGNSFYRQVGSDRVKITSFGKPLSDDVYEDAWKRKWQVRVWPMAYENAVVVSFDLPVPDGYVSLRRTTLAGWRDEAIAQMKLVLDFVEAGYAGTLAQWKDFMAFDKLLPPFLTPAMLQFEYGKSFAWQGPRVAFSYTPQLQAIDKDTRLRLDFGFPSDGDKFVMDVTGVVVADEGSKRTEVAALRHIKPDASADDDARKEWEKRVKHTHPYDAIASTSNDEKTISTTIFGKSAGAEPLILYTFRYRADNSTAQDAMKTKLDLLTKNARVDEH
jgi:serine protease Do